MRLFLGVSSMLLLSTSVAFCCSCVSSGACPVVSGNSGRVFLGTVLSITEVQPRTTLTFLSGRRARFRVKEAFGGIAPDVREIDVLTGMGGGDCGFPFEVGEVYLVDALIGKDGLTRAGICSATRSLEQAGTAIRTLRAQRDGRRLPSLAGRIAQHDRNLQGKLGMNAPTPLGNIRVRVKSDGKVYETQADSEGLYAFYGLPSGKYEFTPDIPPGTKLSWYIGSDDPVRPTDVTAGTCREYDIEVFPSGSIQGRVLDSSNELLPHAFVYLVSADQEVLPAERDLYWESQGKEGFFKFVHIPPGNYLVVVNPDDLRKPDFPYRRTFYPGVHERGSAAVITLRGGEQIRNADIRLSPAFLPRRLPVRVTWADGRLIRDYVSVTAKATSKPSALSHIRQKDSNASIIDLSVDPGETYEIEARLTCRYADLQGVGPGATLKSAKVYLAPDDRQTEVLLVMSVTACPVIPGKEILTER